MSSVAIEYCVPCGHLDQAQELEHALLSEFGREIDAVSLVTGDGGVFEVSVDDEVVFDVDEEGYDEEEIVSRVGDRL